MIGDPHVFDEQYVPRRLEHRDPERDQLARALRPAIHGEPAEDVLISGPSGVGKTVLSRHAMEALEERGTVETIRLRCLGLTEREGLAAILHNLGAIGDDEITTGLPRTELGTLLHQAIDEPTIVVLDEADAGPATALVEDLNAAPLCSVVAIAHDANAWRNRLNVDVQHCFEADGHVRLDRYGVGELADILATRADRGLVGDVLENRQLRTIADQTAGVARYAIQTLVAAAEIATDNGHHEIQDGDIAEAFSVARSRIRKGQLRSLTLHHHVLYALVHDAGRVESEELHRRYDSIAEDIYRGRVCAPIGRRSRRNKLSKLVEYNLLEAVGQKSGRQYAVREGDIAPPIEINPVVANSK
jgi:Cdc6-like AAA superfamily ATPase